MLSPPRAAALFILLHATAALRVGYVEYHAVVEEAGPAATLATNAARTAAYLPHAAARGVDLLVLPEYGITGFAGSTRASWRPYMIPVPDALVDTVPCGNRGAHGVLRTLSCAAQEAGVAAVVDVLEVAAGGARAFNTALAFNKAGRLVGRARKANLWGEAYLDTPQECSTTVFTLEDPGGAAAADATPFGLFVCADMIFYHPAVNLTRLGVQHLIVPVAWDNSMAQMQIMPYVQGWSLVNNATVIVANHRGAWESGSGVFSAGRRVASLYDTVHPNTSSPLTAVDLPALPKNRPRPDARPEPTPPRVSAAHARPSGQWSLAPLLPGRHEYCTPSAQACCTVNAPGASPSEAAQYVVGVIDGTESWYGLVWGAVACGVWPGSVSARDPFAYGRPAAQGLARLSVHLAVGDGREGGAQPVPQVLLTRQDAPDNQVLLPDIGETVGAGGWGVDVTAPGRCVVTSAFVYGRAFERDTHKYMCLPLP